MKLILIDNKKIQNKIKNKQIKINKILTNKTKIKKYLKKIKRK